MKIKIAIPLIGGLGISSLAHSPKLTTEKAGSVRGRIDQGAK
jgi:hypothetical protein